MERDIGKYNAMAKTVDFNSHAHVERDAKDWYEYSTEVNFNSHAHVERDTFTNVL